MLLSVAYEQLAPTVCHDCEHSEHVENWFRTSRGDVSLQAYLLVQVHVEQSAAFERAGSKDMELRGRQDSFTGQLHSCLRLFRAREGGVVVLDTGRPRSRPRGAYLEAWLAVVEGGRGVERMDG